MILTEENAIVAEQNAVARELRHALGYEDPEREPLPVTPALAFRLAEVAAMAEEVKRLRDERDAARKDAEELRLTLLAEQGNAEGAPEGWTYDRRYRAWRKVGGLQTRRIGTSWAWQISKPVGRSLRGRAPTARAAMQAADHDLFESRQARCIALALKLKTDGVILWPPNSAHQQTPAIMLDRLTDPNLTEAVLAVYEALL